MKIKRRSFLASAAGAVTSAGLGAKLTFAGREKSRLESLRVAVVGFGGRGKALISAIRKSRNGNLVAVADVDERVLAGFKPSYETGLTKVSDFRRLLDRDDIDIIASATPNHWHTLISVMAMQAGKHVYIEKPISHNMFESRAIVSCSQSTGKLVQCGFQNRSDSGLVDFYDRLHSGDFGKVTFVHGTCHRPRRSIGKLNRRLEIPKQIDYDLWLGPAKDLPLSRPRLHYDWHWDFNTGNGDVGNQGPHEWDLMNWALGDPELLPTKMVSAGNRFGWRDAGNTPNVMATRGILNDVPFCFEVMDLVPGASPAHNRAVGVIIETDMGRFIGGRGGGQFVGSDGNKTTFQRTKKQDGTVDHMQNFLDAVATNDRKSLRSECTVAARSSSMAHMANISYQLATQTDENYLVEAFAGSSEGSNMLKRMMSAPKIFADQHKIETMEEFKLGPELQFDNQTHQFVGEFGALANQKMSRQYRSGFSVQKLVPVI